MIVVFCIVVESGFPLTPRMFTGAHQVGVDLLLREAIARVDHKRRKAAGSQAVDERAAETAHGVSAAIDHDGHVPPLEVGEQAR